ncbi:MAG: DUF21 domain-containing protein, partial [Chlamydiia bacterium]|nr:DUF21 domain-containing protein [Chlamydiia bacterium]
MVESTLPFMTILFVFLLVFLLCLSSFSSASETAFFSLSPLTVRSYRSSSHAKKKQIAKILDSPRDLLVTLLIFNIIANLLIQNVVSSLFGTFSNWMVKVGVPLVLVLIFGEVLPKSIAITNNEEVSSFVVPGVSWLIKGFSLVRTPLTKATNWISRLLFFFFSKEKQITPEELHHLLKTSEKSGVLLPQECYLVEGSLRLQSSLIKEQMRPREEILFYNIQDPIDKLIHLMVDLATTRVPVCEKGLDHLLGICHTRDFLFHKDRIDTGKDLVPFLKKPIYVPESTRSWSFLKNLRDKDESLAMVIDEYGSISGLITQE